LKFIGNDAYKVNVSTIHSFAQDVISSFPEKFLEYRASEPIDDVDSLEILKGILDDFIDS
jgi:N-acetyl-anhydromuramyl-L-alanine amidase AmpD